MKCIMEKASPSRRADLRSPYLINCKKLRFKKTHRRLCRQVSASRQNVAELPRKAENPATTRRLSDTQRHPRRGLYETSIFLILNCYDIKTRTQRLSDTFRGYRC